MFTPCPHVGMSGGGGTRGLEGERLAGYTAVGWLPTVSPADTIAPQPVWGQVQATLICPRTELQRLLTALSNSVFSFSLFNKMFESQDKRPRSRVLGKAGLHRDRVPCPLPWFLQGCTPWSHLFYSLVSGAFVFSSTICFASFLIFHI